MKIQFEEFLTGIDSVMIVDENYIILHALKINTRESKILKNPDRNHHKYVNRSIFDIFPSISVAESSYTEARRSMRPVVRFNQNYTDCFGMVCRTNNITIPLLRQGKVSGFVGLAKDITTVDAIINTDKDTLQRTRTISPPSTGNSFEDIVTQDSTMEKMITLSKKLATQNIPILVYGETGTGKELFVQAIIRHMKVSRNKVVTQNCAAIPDNLIESILFGTTKGSFTGAETSPGLVKLADGGILFLDELSSLPYHVQGSLLRVIQDGTYRPVGSDKECKSSARIIAAMNVNPREAIEKNT